MHFNHEEQKKQELRTLFLQGGYGQFSLLEKLFTDKELLSTSPRLLVKQLCFRLSVEKSDFKQDSLRHWLNRFRKSKSTTPKPIVNGTAAISISTEQDKGNEKLDFIFSDPSIMKKKELPLFEIVNTKNNNK
jgi:hypothetical protein